MLPGEHGDDSLDLRVGWKLRQAQATNEKSSPRGDKLNGDTPRLPILPTPSCCFPWRKRGLEPTEEIAKALLFHDSLFIRTGLATKSRAHSHKNMICKEEDFAGLEGAYGGKFCMVLFPFFSSFLFAVIFLFL